jgi:hypothetical protein
MIERLDDMPPGTIGFRATAHVSRDDYREVLLPPLRAAARAGEVRMLFAIGPGFEGFEPGALMEDSRAGLTLGIGHPHAWKRTAIVTDVDWITKAIHMFTWLVPGEILVRGLDGLDEAKAWVAAE